MIQPSSPAAGGSSRTSLPSTAAYLPNRPGYFRSLADAVRDPGKLLKLLDLPGELLEPARRAGRHFPLLVPRSFVARMTPGDAADPLLKQVLPLGDELAPVSGFVADAVGDADAKLAPGLLQKYHGRALLVAAGTCAVHCRYCFRRHYPYADGVRDADEWSPALTAIAADESLSEIILSGGDPLMLTDGRFARLVSRLDEIPHLARLRIHTRQPIVLPDRVTDSLLALLAETRFQVVVVLHANHANELRFDAAEAIARLRGTGATMLNQAVLLRGCERHRRRAGESVRTTVRPRRSAVLPAPARSGGGGRAFRGSRGDRARTDARTAPPVAGLSRPEVRPRESPARPVKRCWSIPP